MLKYYFLKYIYIYISFYEKRRMYFINVYYIHADAVYYGTTDYPPDYRIGY